MVSYRQSFAAVRKDPHWRRKIAFGVLISLIPYVGMVWLWGWQMQYQRAVAWGEDERISDWSDFKGQALLGLKLFVAVLPYSLALSVITTPILMGAMFAFVATAPSASATSALWLLIGTTVWFVAFMLLTVLLIPLTASVTLRVSLFGTIESGFQLREIWRLMRANRGELGRAWGFSTLNLGLVYLAMLAIAALAFLAIFVAVTLLSSDAAKVIATIVLVILGYLAYTFFGTAFAIYLGMVNVHLFGTYGRTAYALQDHPRLSGPPQVESARNLTDAESV